ncbi:hypothetical protein ACFL6S_08045 [Candidatus Poribacteria bacterium]
MAERLPEKWSRIIHRMDREREYRIICGETKLTVTAIFLIDDNWKIFKEYREIIPRRIDEMFIIADYRQAVAELKYSVRIKEI